MNHVRDIKSIIGDKIDKDSDTVTSHELVIQEDRCDILEKGVPIATMNNKTHIALNSLSCKEKLKYTGIISRSELHQKLTAAAKSSNAGSSKFISQISILIFGPRLVASELAKGLARYHLYLQHPSPIPTHVSYENPQYLGMVGSKFFNGALLPPLSTEVHPESTSRDDQSDEYQGLELTDIIDLSPKHDYLRETNISINLDGKIKFPLLTCVFIHLQASRIPLTCFL